MTFSLLGRCQRTGRFGIALTSSSPAVPSRCAYVATGVGVATTQNVTDPRLGPALLDALREGRDAAAAVEAVVAAAPNVEYRQLAVVDGEGRSAAHSGTESLGINGDRPGAGCVAAGNLLASLAVLEAAVASFEAGDPEAELEERLLLGLEAGIELGGEAGPVHSAGLLASGSGEAEWPITNLRVDFDPDGGPVAELRRLWSVWEPQRDDYVVRALDPSGAPAYGVPGDPAE
ncbi:MAG: DUF1028 domain-containing protein [Actinobacteria bacterium]|nr:DUF1028 domain-containing protein [Actinomycetota bacterium]